ncbi:maleylpyruvate isomerase family mycothiol-dependent enzyme [Streptomyces sp. NPDC054863]
MEKTLEFPDLLRLIDERSTAFRAAVASAPSLDVQVPTCPEWTLFDLVRHLGEGRRAWAATVTAGPAAATKSAPEGPAAPREREALPAWSAAATQELLDALREAGPDRGCWTWWGTSQSPQTCGAVARHQLQEIAVHTYDAQITLGAPQPLPDEVALDGVDEFLSTCCATTNAWPHEPAAVDIHTTEGRSWHLSLSADGARITPATGEDQDVADASLRGTASELVLALYGRTPVDSLKLDGDLRLLDLLWAWDPTE